MPTNGKSLRFYQQYQHPWSGDLPLEKGRHAMNTQRQQRHLKKQNQNQPNSKIVKKKTHLYVPEPHVVAALAQDPPSHVYITITILMKA